MRQTHNLTGTSAGCRCHARGLSLIEAMFLLVVVSIVAVAAGVGLQSVAKVPANTDSIMAVNNVMVNVMEQTKGNFLKNWPSGNVNSSNYAVIIAGTTYTPSATTINNTAYNYGAPPVYPTVSSSLTINSKTYRLCLAVDQADPGGGSTYKSDYYRVTVAIIPYVNGSLAATGQQTLVTYVAQP